GHRRRRGPLRAGAGGQVVAVQPQELGHRRIQVAAARRRRTAATGHQVRHVVLGYLHGLRELTRRALELPQTAPEKQTDLHGILEGRGCWHLFEAPFERHMKWPTECNAVGAHRGPRYLNIARTARYWYPSGRPERGVGAATPGSPPR